MAHFDDLEFCFGGLLHRFREQLDLRIVILSSREQNTGETLAEALADQSAAARELGIASDVIRTHDFRARFLPDHRDAIRLVLNEVAREFAPDVVWTHFLRDTHQDHVAVAEEVLRVLGHLTVLGGETVNTGINIQPRLFVELSEADVEAKIRAIQCYRSERHKAYFSPDVLWAQARLRGTQSRKFALAETGEVYRLNLS